MEFRVTWQRSEQQHVRVGTPRMWCWVLPLAVIQIVMGVFFWRHVQAQGAAEQAGEESFEGPDVAADPDSVMLYTNPVAVTVTRDYAQDEALIVARHGNCQFEYRTRVSGSDATPWLECVRQGVGWKGDYLFVMNVTEINAWRGSTDAVLKLQDGRLVEIGTIARDHQESKETLGPGYHHGYFHDLIDLYEGEIGHFGSKGVGWIIAMREEQGRFVADLKRTWAENQKTIKANEESGAQLMKEGNQDGLLSDDLLARFGENVLIAKYCARTNDVVKAWLRVRDVLQLSERKRLANMETRITPGAVPCYGHP